MYPWSIDPVDLTIRLSIALALGGLIGLERERHNHPAGFRTHILVCLGSTLIMLLSMYGFSDFVYEENVRMDPARLAANVITGIGFLGAGVILRVGVSITGLTTAASLWVVAAIGLAIGAGFYYAAGLTTGLVLFSLFILNKVEKKWFPTRKNGIIKIQMIDKPNLLEDITTILEKQKIELLRFSTKKVDENNPTDNSIESLVNITLYVNMSSSSKLIPTLDKIRESPKVLEVKYD